jgi:TrmH family RNA methyltransferase
LSQLELPTAPLIAVIESVEKPGNVGAILRSADGAGVDAVVIADPRTDLFNPNTIRASLGTVFDQNVCTASGEETLAWLRRLNVTAYAARPDAEQLYTQADYRRGAAIVLGSEAEGLSELWRGAGVAGIRLPMRGIADSLNVSATAAVLFYEAQRQRST